MYVNELLLQANGGVQLQIQATDVGVLVMNGQTTDNGNITGTTQTLPVEIDGTTYYLQLFIKRRNIISI